MSVEYVVFAAKRGQIEVGQASGWVMKDGAIRCVFQVEKYGEGCGGSTEMNLAKCGLLVYSSPILVYKAEVSRVGIVMRRFQGG